MKNGDLLSFEDEVKQIKVEAELKCLQSLNDNFSANKLNIRVIPMADAYQDETRRQQAKYEAKALNLNMTIQEAARVNKFEFTNRT